MTSVDKILELLRYAYYVKCKPLVSDRTYDELEKLGMKTVGSDKEGDYLQEIKDLYDFHNHKKEIYGHS